MTQESILQELERRAEDLARLLVSLGLHPGDPVVPQRLARDLAPARDLAFEQGVDVIFGYPGGSVLPIYDELFQQDDVQHILVRHEQGAGHAAEGYARSTGKCGVVLVTSGPGATNLITGLADAFRDSRPVIALTGNTATTAEPEAFQAIDIVGMTHGKATKASFRPERAEDVQPMLVAAYHAAVTGRPGSVLVDFPKDIQIKPSTMRPWEEFIARHAKATTGADWLMQSSDNTDMSIYLHSLANGQEIKVDLSTPEARAAYERGVALSQLKIGQFNFSCTDCHQKSAGKWARGQWLGESKGQFDHFPLWRTSRNEIWDIRKRLQWCNVQVRANELPPDAVEYGEIELYLRKANEGLKLTAPNIRH